MKLGSQFLSLVLMSAVTSASHAGDVEVLHWWTSGGEARALSVLSDELNRQGHQWHDFAIEGGGGESAMTVLATRAISGNPPSAAQIKGYDIQEWASLGFLADLNEVADQEHWDTILPPFVQKIVTYHDTIVAVPFNIQRSNWLWYNKPIFERLGLSVPNSLAEFFAVAERLKENGIIPLAHGSQPWQDATLFEAVALAQLGMNLYRRAFVDLDFSVLGGENMVQVFTQFQRFRQYIDVDAPGRDWNDATEMVINGQAAMQVMGDWAKGEFHLHGKEAGVDFGCVAAFGTDDTYNYSIDSFIFFQLSDPEAIQAQNVLANSILTSSVQKQFNREKGSIPIRQDVDISDFDVCAQRSKAAFLQAEQQHRLVPSMAHGMATSTYVQGAIYDVASRFFNDPDADPKAATRRLVQSIKAAM